MQKTFIICESTKGGADKKFIKSLISTHNLLKEFVIHTTEDLAQKQTGSIDDVKKFIIHGLYNAVVGKYQNILIIVDADEDANERFKEILSCFKNQSNNFELPKKINDPIPNSLTKINVGIFLMPNNNDKGGLETLCLQGLKHNRKEEKLRCIKSYIDCLQNKRIDQGLTTNNKDKAKFRIYHATPNPDGYVHDLLNAVDIDSTCFDNLKAFISQANR
jgi:hypothetical protein